MKVEFPVVKKLPVLFIGNISTIKIKINGIIVLLLLRDDFKKYFFIKDK